jgi:hypothetical protein
VFLLALGLTDRIFTHRLLPVTLVTFVSVLFAYVVVSSHGRLLVALYLLVALCVAATLPPHWFIAGSVLVFAVSTAWSSPVVLVGSAEVYVSDVMVVLVAVRGALRRDRLPSNRALVGLPAALFAVWAIVMAIAVVRGLNAGVPLPSAIRGETALVYYPLLYFGFSRMLRETDMDVSVLWRNLAVIALGLAGWMFLARALHHPFHDPGLAKVPTGAGQSVLRNFGFAGAFIVYPVLALVGIAGMAHGGRRRWAWTVLALVGTMATLTSLIRGEIFGLALGVIIILWLRPRTPGTSLRVRTAMQFVLAIVAATAGLIAIDPALGHAVVQRALPFTQQAEGAKANAEYRQRAVSTGIRVAREHPTGVGVLDTAGFDDRHIDPGYFAHSGVATLLFFGGWPALVSAFLVVLSLLWRSFRFAAPTPWLHPAFVAVLVSLSVYTISALGLAGDLWVISLGALAVALRFTPSEPVRG